jgi:hypothetical protein
VLQISALQLAELLSGIARAQAALVHGLETVSPGTRVNYILPAIQNVAHLRDHPYPTLTDLPVRILLSYISRVGPDPAQLARELERLFGGDGSPAPAAGASAGPSANPLKAPAPDAGDSLDFSQS